jgi:hypothetical protein
MMYEIEKGPAGVPGKGSGSEIGLIPRKVKIAYDDRGKAFERASSSASTFKG